MPTPLTEWQRRLEQHFTGLAAARATSGLPLFALEHGLSTEEMASVRQLLRAAPAEDLPLGLHWLVWVVCASEAGYDYTGGEYWPILAQHGPQWLELSHHQRLREWFEKFQGRYQGVRPTGAWANHFKYIAWPITHAVLPSYLQEQFTRTLFSLRYRLARLDDARPTAVGRFLSENSWDASSRMREFLQQENLVGRITLALLSDAASDEASPIYPPTLRRILADLERVQSAKEWLKETRRYVSERLKTAGRAYGAVSLKTSASPTHRIAGEGPSATPLISKAAVVLRPSGGPVWSVLVEIPSLAGIARQASALRDYIQKTRCKLAGVEDGWRPGGWLLANSQRPRLRSWPKPGETLLQFERPNDAFQQIAGDALRLTEGPTWVCRLGDDGLAHEIATRIVRPGRRYILLSETPLPTDGTYAALVSCQVDCTGVYAGLLSMPSVLTADDLTRLAVLGVQVARTVRIWPAGLPARSWDGEGRSEWLTTETPCFAIVHDHPLSGYGVRVNAELETYVPAGPVGTPVFVSLTSLPVGRHTLTVSARRHASPAPIALPTAEGVMTVDVREPEPWTPGTTAHSGMALTLDPHEPSLDMFWEGNVAVRILGPTGRAVTASILLRGAQGREIHRSEIGVFELPVTAEDWKRRLSPFLDSEQHLWPFLEAASGQLLIRGDELGEFRISLERAVKPLRWLCRHSHNTLTVRVVDDTGGSAPTRVRFFGLGRPSVPVVIATETALAGLSVTAPGGLYEAVNGDHSDSVIASAPEIRGGLKGLSVRPDLGDIKRARLHVGELLQLMHLWAESHLVGPLVAIRREHVYGEILNVLVGELGGRPWAHAETAFLAQPDSETAIQQLQRAVGASPGFVSLLRRDYDRMASAFDQRLAWFSEAAARYEVCRDRELCDFALRMAAIPHSLASLPAPALDTLVKDLQKCNTLYRAGRFLALLSAAKNPSPIGRALPRWTWL